MLFGEEEGEESIFHRRANNLLLLVMAKCLAIFLNKGTLVGNTRFSHFVFSNIIHLVKCSPENRLGTSCFYGDDARSILTIGSTQLVSLA